MAGLFAVLGLLSLTAVVCGFVGRRRLIRQDRRPAARKWFLGWTVGGFVACCVVSYYGSTHITAWLEDRLIAGMSDAATDEVVRALHHPSVMVRRAAAQELATRPEEAATAVTALVAALADQERTVRRAVIQALGDLGPAATGALRALSPLLKDPEHSHTVAMAMIGIGPASVPFATEAATVYQPDIWDKASKVVRVLGIREESRTATLEALRVLLQRGEPRLRESACWMTCELNNGGGPLKPQLLQLLSDGDTRVRWVAAWTIRVTDHARMPDDPRAKAVARELQAQVRTALKSSDPREREAAVALLQWGNEPLDERMQVLQVGLRDAASRFAAVERLRAMGPAGAPLAGEVADLLVTAGGNLKLISDAQMALEAFGTAGASAAPVLVAYLRQPGEKGTDFEAQMRRMHSQQIRGAAIRSLGAMGEGASAALEVLIPLLDSGEHAPDAAVALGQIGLNADQVVPKLIAMLEGERVGDEGMVNYAMWCRLAATKGLASFGETAAPAVPALTNALTDEDDAVRRHAARALEMVGEAAEPALPALRKAAIDDGDQWVRAAAKSSASAIEKRLKR